MGLGEKGAATTGGVVPLWEETTRRLEQWWEATETLSSQDFSSVAPIVIVTGFVAKTAGIVDLPDAHRQRGGVGGDEPVVLDAHHSGVML